MQLRPYQIDLIEQVRKAYQEGYRRPCIVLGCGGGKSVIAADMAKRTTQKGNRVLFLVHRQELCEQIENTFREYGVDMQLCQVGMVQTITRRFKRIPIPDLIITDENHHCLAKSYRKIYDAFPNARCVGITATPIRLNGGGLGDVNDKLIFGVSTKWLMEHQFLAPYEYYAPKLFDPQALRTRNGEYVLEDMKFGKAIYGDVIHYYRKLSDGKKAICYCATIRHSQEMAERFWQSGIRAAHIDGTTPKAVRQNIIEAFRAGNIQVLCNVDLISEGFDVPDCNTSILLRPTKSLTLYIQQSMRCMRYQKGKKALIIDHVGNYSRFGLPDDDRAWSLESKPKASKDVNETPVKECDECYRVVPAACQICPHCGYEFPKPSRELEEIRREALEQVKRIVMDYDRPEDCQTIRELQVYAQNHGYKPGWVYYQAKARGITA